MRDGAPVPPNFQSLNLSDFAFEGFGDSLSDIARRLGRIGIRRDEPKVSVIDRAIFVPSETTLDAEQKKTWSGGLMTADGLPIEAARLRRKGKVRAGSDVTADTLEPKQEADEEVVYLGPLFNHFGRVLLESLARVWYLSEVKPDVRVVFDYPNATPNSHGAWVERILTAFGVPMSRILILDSPTRLQRAIVPEPLFEQGNVVHETMIRPFREVAARIASYVTPTEQPVYLSRGRLGSRQRPIIGEAELEEVLKDNGFLIVYPETMDFEDQVRLVNHHATIVTGIGSAAHNILFARSGPRLHLLTNGDQIPVNYYLCSAVAEVPTTFIDCLGTGGRGSFAEERKGGGRRGEAAQSGPLRAPGGQATPQKLDLAKISEYLDRQGLLKKRSWASRADHDSVLQNQYDEAWLYARVRRANPTRGKNLPADIEREAVRLATESWPMSWILARYYASDRQYNAQAETMTQQFIDLVMHEVDPDRLAYYRDDVDNMVARIARVIGAEFGTRLTAVIADRFGERSTENG